MGNYWLDQIFEKKNKWSQKDGWSALYKIFVKLARNADTIYLPASVYPVLSPHCAFVIPLVTPSSRAEFYQNKKLIGYIIIN